MYRNIKLLKWFNFFTDLKLYGPIAVIYFSGITNSFAQGMSIFSLVFLSSALFEVPTGIFSDYIGRKNTLILGAVSAVICTILYAIGVSYWILVIGAVFEGLSRSFYSGNNEALLYDSLEGADKKAFHEYFGKIASMFQIALAISALVGSILATYSFALVLWLSVIPQIICLFISLRLDIPRLQVQADSNIYLHLSGAIHSFKKNTRLRRLSLATMLNEGIAEAAFDFQAAFYKTVWPLWAVGVAKMLSYVGATLSFYFGSRLIKKFGAIKIILLRHTLNRIVFSIALLFPTKVSPILMSSGSLLYGAEVVAVQSLAQQEYSDRKRATMGSLVSLGGSIVFSVSAVILGVIADIIGPAKALFIVQLSLVVVMWLYWSVYKTNKVL